MRILGLEITRATRSVGPPLSPPDAWPPINGGPGGGIAGGGWFPIIREGNTGDWQRNIITPAYSVLGSVWVFRCISLIANDIAKLCLELQQETDDDIWTETTSAAFTPVLTSPNSYQTRIQFIESWLISKLSRGNAYVLKERDQRGVVTALHVLHPDRVRPMVSPDGSVFYQLGRDLLAQVGDPHPDLPAVPASEIIHDRWNCLFHPLVGLSPIFACGSAALQGITMQDGMTQFFRNGAAPGGVLTAPGHIADDTAQRLKNYWDSNFSGSNAGKVAVLGDGLTFQGLMVTAADSQFIEQLKWTGETICAVFGVPAYMVNLGDIPRNVSIEAMAQMYYSQGLQIHVESIELLLQQGLSLPNYYTVSFDLDGLLRMDQASQITALVEGIGGGLFAPNEGRKKMNLGPVDGGETPYLQQQNYSLGALARRDEQASMAPASGGLAGSPSDTTPPADTPPQDAGAADTGKVAAALLGLQVRLMGEVARCLT